LSRSLFDAWRAPRGVWRLSAAILVGLLLVVGGALAHASGGPTSPWVHAMYLPILLSAVFFGTAGGLITAVVAGLIIGPWMPDARGDGLVSIWLVSTLFFALVGGLAGQAQHLLAERLEHGESMVEKLATVHARTLTAFASTVDLRDRPTAGHSARVAHNARAVALVLDLPDESVRTIYWAGLLHDLGKLAVPEKILQKPGRLDGPEIEQMRRHSNIGADLVLSLSVDLRPIAEGIRSHHERWDGRGYPLGLAGEEIPLAGRILTVVDVFEALTCARPYRRPALAREAMAYLREGSGAQFDDGLVDLFEDLYWRGSIYTAADPRAALTVEEPPMVVSDDGALEPVLQVAGAMPDYHSGSSGRP
jgi:putative nucleotidyltransferase with HDIG domain